MIPNERIEESIDQYTSRLARTLRALSDWHVLNKLGLFDLDKIPDNLRQSVDQTIKETEAILTEWGAIKEYPKVAFR